jgi:hypothetical protein
MSLSNKSLDPMHSSVEKPAHMGIALPVKNTLRAFLAAYGTGDHQASRLPYSMGPNDKKIGRFIPFFALFL